MSRHSEKPPRREVRKLRKTTFKGSPCGRPPVAPTGLTGTYDVNEHGPHNRLRLNMKWDEVATDTSLSPIRIRNYKVEMEYTANGTDWFLHDRITVSAKDDDDDNAKAHKIARSLHGRLAYRFKVRAMGLDGCKSEWSEWLEIAAYADTPPAPFNVHVFPKGKDRVNVEWDADTESLDTDLFDDRIHHFLVEISKSASFATNYRKNRSVKGQHTGFRILDADLEDTFYVRVRSISPDKSKSAWIPATKNDDGNDNPASAPDGVIPGAKAKVPQNVTLTFDSTEKRRHEVWRAKTLWDEVSQNVNNDNHKIRRYDVRLQKSDNGSSADGDTRRATVNAKDADSDTTAYKLWHAINERKWYRTSVRAQHDGDKPGDWSSWTSWVKPSASTPSAPVNVTIHHKTRGKDKVVMDWDVPTDAGDSDLPDETVDYFQVVLKKDSSTTPTTIASGYKADRFVRASERTFRVPRTDEDSTFYGWVRSISASGVKSSWIPAKTAGNSSAGAAADGIQTDDGVKIGRIVKHAMSALPQGYLRADGSVYSPSTYPELFAAIGTTYGGTSGSPLLPDHRRRQARGVGSGQALGQNEGVAEGSRVETHGKHNRGQHGQHKNHHHRHGHGGHRHNHPHGNHNHGAHDHGLSGTNTDGPGTVTGKAGSTSNAAGPAHTHSIGSGQRTHPARDTSDGGSDMPDSPAPAEDAIVTTDDFGSAQVSPTDPSNPGASITIDDPAAPGGEGHNQHNLPDDDNNTANQGHGHSGHHPHIRFHYDIKAY